MIFYLLPVDGDYRAAVQMSNDVYSLEFPIQPMENVDIHGKRSIAPIAK